MTEHHPSYSEDLERCARLLRGILYIVEIITNYEDETPYMTALVTALCQGVPAHIKVKCSHGEDNGICHIDSCTVSLNDFLDIVEQCMEQLKLELYWEMGYMDNSDQIDTKLL